MTNKGSSVAFAEYGDKNGRLVVYFHGAPGSTQECSLFDSHAKQHNLRIICFDRFAINQTVDDRHYYQQLASQINNLVSDESIDIIGFSIGAQVALEVGAILSNQVRHIHLISPAAPLNAGDFIDSMAGAPVFKLALKKPFLFSLLAQCQKLMALLAPQLLVGMLFANAAGKDKQLCHQKAFKRYITPVIKRCFQYGIKGYIRDIKLYVMWSGDLASHTSSVHLWHGTEDNWSPLAMSSFLSQTIPRATTVKSMEGLSHYSCLYEAAPRICEQLQTSSFKSSQRRS